MNDQSNEVDQLRDKLDRVGYSFKILSQALSEFNEVWLQLPADVRQPITTYIFGRDAGQGYGRAVLRFEE